jgi:hypothetical protein
VLVFDGDAEMGHFLDGFHQKKFSEQMRIDFQRRVGGLNF